MAKGKDVPPGDDAQVPPVVVTGKGTTASVKWVEGDLMRKVIGSTAKGGGRAVERIGESVTGGAAGIDNRMTLSDEQVVQEVERCVVGGLGVGRWRRRSRVWVLCGGGAGITWRVCSMRCKSLRVTTSCWRSLVWKTHRNRFRVHRVDT